MASIAQCGQCGKTGAEREVNEPGSGWVAAKESHEEGHCEDSHKLFCSWGCAGIWATAKTLIGE